MVEIKPYDPKYKDELRQVCINTGPKETATDKNTRDFIIYTFCDYYLEQEPQNVFALVDENDTAQGYVFGAEDFARYRKGLTPYLRKVRKTGLKNYVSALGEVFLHRLFSGKYPAHLHIDINEGFRGGGNGSRMIQKQLENMRSKGIKGIMLVVGTENKRGIKFYEKNGFKRLLTLPDGTVMAKEL